jgi:molybdopterin biosynthesis enzyme
MALLPSERYVINQSDGIVSLEDTYSEETIARFDPSNMDATARAQKDIYDSQLSDEDKCFAHFWSGYFYAHATR